MSQRLRLAYAGTPDFALPALAALQAANHDVVGVWTQPDRPAGRGRKLTPSPVKKYALKCGLTVHQPASLRNAEAQAAIRDVMPDVMVVIAYGLLLPRTVLEIPHYGGLNIHASLLPRWRGAAPIQRAILAGDAETGVTIMQMDAGLDTGPMLMTRQTFIQDDDTAQTLHDRLAQLGAEAIVETLAGITRLQPVPQDEAHASYAAKLTREEAQLDWTRPADELARCVRGYHPWPVAYTYRDGERLRIWQAHALNTGTQAEPGKVVAISTEGIDIATGRGVLRITQLQPAGGRVMPAAAFMHGRALTGARFD